MSAFDGMPGHDVEKVLSISRREAWILAVWHRVKTAFQNEGTVEQGLTLAELRQTVTTTLRKAGLGKRRIATLRGSKLRPLHCITCGQRTL